MMMRRRKEDLCILWGNLVSLLILTPVEIGASRRKAPFSTLNSPSLSVSLLHTSHQISELPPPLPSSQWLLARWGSDYSSSGHLAWATNVKIYSSENEPKQIHNPTTKQFNHFLN